MKNKYIIFDLDDTLYYEIDYLKSAYQEIASRICKEDNHLYNKMLKLYQEGKNSKISFFAMNRIRRRPRR